MAAAPWGNMPPQLQTNWSISTQPPKTGLLAYETVDDICLCASAIPTAEVSGNDEGSLRLARKINLQEKQKH